MARRKKTANVQLKVRMKEPLRARLEKAAKSRGVSLNAESVERLERSFEIEERLGGPRLVDLIETIASVMKATGQHAGFVESRASEAHGGEWLLRPYAFDQAMKAAVEILERFRPTGEIVVPEPDMVAVVGLVGTGLDQTARGERLHQLLTDLGPLMADRAIRDREQADE